MRHFHHGETAFVRSIRHQAEQPVGRADEAAGISKGGLVDAFGSDVDYAQLVKLYGQDKKRSDDREWYAPVRVVAAIPTPVQGEPDLWKISTSHVERQNLTMPMKMRRFTRLTNGFSKKLDNLKAAVALYFF